MKCKYYNDPGGCAIGCKRGWIKCHGFFDGRGCDLPNEARCNRGWHFNSPEEYKSANEAWARRREITISSDDSDEEPRRKRRKQSRSESPQRPRGSGMRPEKPAVSASAKGSASSEAIEKANLGMHIANLGMEITGFEDKTIDDINAAYRKKYARMTSEKASMPQLMHIATSYQEVMISKRKKCRERSTTSATAEGEGE